MSPAMIYIIKSMMVLTLLYVPYMLLLRKESFFRFNRMMLLGIVVLSVVLPLLNIPLFDIGVHPFEGKGEVTVGMPTIVGIGDGGALVAPGKADKATGGIDWWSVLCWTYATGMAVTCVVKLLQVIGIYRRIHHGVMWTDKVEGSTVYCHCGDTAPFSWFRSIVISEKDYEQNGDVIIRHELGHIRHHHSSDMMLVNVFQIIQWANPFAWMLGSSMRDIHEYEADDTVLRSGVSAREYMCLLMRKAVGSSSYAFANGFNHSLLKKRITMMLRKKSNPWMRTKALYAIPMATLALSAFATPLISSQKLADELYFSDADSKVTEIIPNQEISTQENANEAVENDANKNVTEAGQLPLLSSGQDEETLPADNPKLSVNEEPGSVNASQHDKTSAAANPSLAQSPDTVAPANYSATLSYPASSDDDKIYDTCEQLPEYPGGFEALMQDLMNNIRYPRIAHENGVEGYINVLFVVEKDGKCSSFEIAKATYNQLKDRGKTEAIILTGHDFKEETGNQGNSESKGLSVVGFSEKNAKSTETSKEVIASAQKAMNDEALRVVKLLKQFKPGIQDGKPVRVKFNLPVFFKLQ